MTFITRMNNICEPRYCFAILGVFSVCIQNGECRLCLVTFIGRIVGLRFCICQCHDRSQIASWSRGGQNNGDSVLQEDNDKLE
jgi:hypothetical protein